MDKQLQNLQSQLESAIQRADDEGIEFWFARDLQGLLGYARWENFQTAILRAMESCEGAIHAPSDHFRGVTKMVGLGSGSKRVRYPQRLPLTRFQIRDALRHELSWPQYRHVFQIGSTKVPAHLMRTIHAA
ncbi:MAG: hypothetical protein ACOYM2_11090 [Rectinemataceae bacterium]